MYQSGISGQMVGPGMNVGPGPCAQTLERASNPSLLGTTNVVHEQAERVLLHLFQILGRLEMQPVNGSGADKRPETTMLQKLSLTHDHLCHVDKLLSELEQRIFG